MNQAETLQVLQSAFDNAEIDVKVEGSHYHVSIVSSAFDGVRAVKRQQMVYAALNEAISSGAIHAVHMQLSSPNEG